MQWRDRLAVAGTTICLLAGGTALGQQPDMLAMRDRDEPAEGRVEGHAVGVYGGVTMGGDHAPPRGRAAHGMPSVTWPGFQMRADGKSSVFVQSTVPLSVQPIKGERKWTVELGEVRVEGTNRLPLDTHFFNSPVTRVALARVGRKTMLELTMRADVEPRVSVVDGKNGYHFLSLEFPAGQYLPTASAKPAAPPAGEGAPTAEYVPSLDAPRERLSVQAAVGAPEAPPAAPAPRSNRVRIAGHAPLGPPAEQPIDLAGMSRDADQVDAQRAAEKNEQLDAESEAALDAELPPGVAPLKGSKPSQHK
jgi:hypothetical protein